MIRQLIPLFLCATLVAQQTGSNKPLDSRQGEVFTLTVGTNLVVETVTVKDKRGNPVSGLAKDDFVVTEDGKPQTVRLFEYQKLSSPASAIASPPGNQAPNLKIFDKLSRSQIAAETSGAPKYRDHRLLAIYFDMTSMPPADQIRALLAADKFVRTQMLPEDLVAILRYNGGAVDVLQDFTADRGRLLSILSTMSVGEGQGLADDNSGGDASDTGAAFGQDDAEFNIFNNDRQLSALQTAAEMLGRLSEKKALIYFASGMNLSGINNQAQLNATVNAAVRAGVSFWPIDARGLIATPPLGDATQAAPGGIAMYTGGAANAVSTQLNNSQDTMYALAADTGGKALLDNNDLTRGIHEAQADTSSYYIIGYYTTNSAKDGRYRRVRIALADQKTGKLSYRQGYYAQKEYVKFNTAEKERQLEDALMQPDPVTDLPIALELNYFQINRSEYFVPVSVKIPGRELALAQKSGSQHTLIDFIGEVKDSASGTTMQNLRDFVDIPLSNGTVKQLSFRPLQYDTGFTLLPGAYTIKFLARDNETGRIGTYESNFTIPNLEKQADHLAMSTVVLSNQLSKSSQALYTVGKSNSRAKIDAADPLLIDDEKILPSVTRVFRHEKPMIVYLQLYQEGSNSPQEAFAYTTIFRVQDGVATTSVQTPVIKMPAPDASRLHISPIFMSVPLDKLMPGDYQCAVTVVTPGNHKAFFWQAPVRIQ